MATLYGGPLDPTFCLSAVLSLSGIGKGAPELDAGESSVGRSPIVASATRKAGGEGLSFLRPSSERKPVPPGFPRMNGELNLSLYVS